LELIACTKQVMSKLSPLVCAPLSYFYRSQEV